MGDVLKLYLPAALVVLLGFWLAYRYVGPPPPSEIRIATGREGGAYQQFARRYRDILARDRVTLTLVETEGSVENLELLGTAAVDLAFVQGGTARAAPSGPFVSLGSLFYEPLWVFVREGVELREPKDLHGRRIAVGREGSGSRVIALELLRAAAGIGPDDPQLLALGGREAARALADGSIDVALVVGAAESRLVQDIAHLSNVVIRSVDNGEGYIRHYRYLSRLEVPPLTLDLQARLPPKPVIVIAPAANLVVREDFHPALVDLLLSAAREVHGEGGLVEARGQFPSTAYLEFPLHPEAARFYEYGPPFLRRYLPFWAATLVDRLKILLLPALALLLPLVRVMPPVYQWRVRRRIYRWYSELRRLDPELQMDLDAATVQNRLAELSQVEDEVKHLKTPLAYADRVYTLRAHINLVRERLLERLRHIGPETGI